MPVLRIRRLPAIVPLLTALLVGVWFGSVQGDLHARANATLSDEDERQFEVFWQAWNLLRSDYVAPDGATPETSVLVDGAIRGMIDALGEEQSGYLDASQFPLLQEEWTGTIEGIGAVVERDEKCAHLKIAWVLSGSPAEAAGLQAGDVFSAVDGKDVLDATQLELAALVRGPAGTVVDLTMFRGDETHGFAVTRQQIDIPNVEWQALEDGSIGYVRLQYFNERTRPQLDEALAELDARALSGLVLDLRDNPGGLLDSAVAVASVFIEDGPLVIQDHGDRKRVLRADGSHAGLNMPLAVLVNGRSASASELVAAALRERGRAFVIGETTFGKGTMQNIFSLENGGGLQLTIARWLTPDKRWIHEVGVQPDLVVEQGVDGTSPGEDLQLQAAIQYLQSMGAEAAA